MPVKQSDYHNLVFEKYKLIEISRDDVIYEDMLEWCMERQLAQNNDRIFDLHQYWICLWFKKGCRIDLTEFKLRWV